MRATTARRPGALAAHQPRKTIAQVGHSGGDPICTDLWPALLRYCDDGVIEIDNSAAERALRGVAIGRRNYLFAGADSGGERAAAIDSLLGTAKLNGIDPEAWLRHLLANSAEHPINPTVGSRWSP